MSEAVSIFDRIVEVEEAKKLRGFDVEEELAYIFTCPKIKKTRDKDVLIARHGLNGEHPRTLEEIGRELKVTRERVRQIEKSAIKKLVDFSDIEKRTQKSFQIVKEQVEKDIKQLIEQYKGADPERVKAYVEMVLVNDAVLKFLESQK